MSLFISAIGAEANFGAVDKEQWSNLRGQGGIAHDWNVPQSTVQINRPLCLFRRICLPRKLHRKSSYSSTLSALHLDQRGMRDRI